MPQPLLLTLEFARASHTGEPFAFQFEPQLYLLRTSGGGFASAELPWGPALLGDLQALRLARRDAAVLQRVGDWLRSWLEPLGWAQYEARIREALANQMPVSLTIRSAAAELYALPWELLTLHHTGQHLGELAPVTVRYEWPETHAISAMPSSSAGGRILLAWSAAGGAVPSGEHQAAIARACEAGHHPFDPQRDVLPQVSASELSAALERAQRSSHPVAILHLLCRGSADGGSISLIFTNATMKSEPLLITADGLRQLLAPYGGMLRLVVLCVCSSGNEREPVSQLGSVAQGLHRAGIAAVVASRFPLSIVGSVRFTSMLYSQLLVELTSLESALGAARRHLAEDAHSHDWASVQLYAHADDGDDTRPVLIRPYRGLLAFTAEHTRLYYGREREIDEVLADLAVLRRDGKPRLYVITGASGTGKSSILPAGILPRLLGSSEPWDYGWMRPGSAPRKSLAALLEKRPTESENLLLLVDQFEELFTHTESAGERTAFVQELWQLACAKDSGVTVVLALRVDYLGSCGELVLGAEGLRLDSVVYDEAHRLFLAQSTPQQLRSAIRQPAERTGFQLEAGLEDRLLDDVGAEPGALPLLEYTLDRLWEQRQGRVLTQRAYDEMGGVSGALNQRADALVAAFTPPQRQAARRLLVRLVDVGAGMRPATRRRQPLAKLRPAAQESAAHFDKVLEVLVDERLLVRDQANEHESIEVAHEALIRRWKKLQEWVMADRMMLAELEKVESWVESCENYHTFLVGDQLGYAQEVRRSYPEELTPRALTLLDRSVAEQARRARSRRLGAAALWVLSVAALTSAGAAWRQTWLGHQRQQQAVEVAGQIVSIGEHRLRKVPGAAEARRELLALVDKLLSTLRASAGEDGRARSVERRRLREQADVILQNPRPSEARLAEAERLYERAKMLAEAELRKQPADTDLQDDLSLSLDGLGDVFAMAGKLPEAREHYQESLELLDKLVAAEPGNARWQEEAADTQDNLGDVDKAMGHLAPARQHYENALAVRTRLAALEPTGAQWQHRLVQSYAKLGAAWQAGGQLKEAHRYYDQCLSLSRALCEREPHNPEWQRILAAAYMSLGYLAKEAGQLPEARQQYAQALLIIGQVAELDPASVQVQRELAWAHIGIGDVLLAASELKEAQQHDAQALALLQKLADSDPGNADWQRELARAHIKIGVVLVAQSEYASARRHYEIALGLTQSLTNLDPTNSGWRLDLLGIHAELLAWSYVTEQLEQAPLHRAAVAELVERFDREQSLDRDPIVSHARQLLRLHEAPKR